MNVRENLSDARNFRDKVLQCHNVEFDRKLYSGQCGFVLDIGSVSVDYIFESCLFTSFHLLHLVLCLKSNLASEDSLPGF